MKLPYDVACLGCGEAVRRGQNVVVVSKVLAGSVVTSYRHPDRDCRNAPDSMKISFLEGFGDESQPER